MWTRNNDIIYQSFEGRYNLIYSDTDSLVYNIQHDNIYQWVKENKSHFDLSDSDREDLTDDEHKQVIGKIKDETNTLPKTETCSSGPDMLFFQNIARRTIRSIIRRSHKGVSKYWVKHQITHDNYMDTMKRMSSWAAMSFHSDLRLIWSEASSTRKLF